MSKKYTGHIVPHTHWDREWRFPLWKSRMLLVEFMEELLDTLENNQEYNYFHLDGQVVMVEDYLEVRPERKEQIIKFVKAGRLGIGPFYTLPDLFPVNGECIVRNIKKGLEVAEKYGGATRIGYHSFGWGQISQFPQIYNDLKIDFLIAAKRVSSKRAPNCEFLWKGPDGSVVLTSRLGKHARANFYFNAYIQIKHGVNYDTNEFTYNWGKHKPAIHNTRSEKQNEDYFVPDSSDTKIHDEHIQKGFQKAWDAYKETTVPDQRLIMDGSDFSYCQPLLPDMINKANSLFPDHDFKLTSLHKYYNKLKETINTKELAVVEGEMRDGAAPDTSANALTTRMYLKLLNRKAENLLVKTAEPLAACLTALNLPFNKEMFRLAWDFLLKAHPHDSINGVTQDKTANDVEYRLNQVVEIAEVLIEDAVGKITSGIDYSSFSHDDVLLFCANTNLHSAKSIAKIVIDTPADKNIWDFSFTDMQGNELEAQSISRKERTTSVYDPDSRSWPFYHDRHEVYIETGEMPPLGYKILRLKPKRTFKREGEWWTNVPVSKGNEICLEPGILENEYLKIDINQQDGTITLTNKENNKKYPNLHYFIDEGDTGDYWAYYPHYHNKIFDSRAARHKSWLAENGPLAATYVVETMLTLPSHGIRANKGIEGESRRSSDEKEMVIVSEFTLKKDDKKLHVKTKVNNNVEDHRLRLMFPTDIQPQFSHAACHFVVEKRPVEPTKSDDGDFFPAMQTYAMQQFVDITNCKDGFGIASNSIGEYEITGKNKNVIALTLFRSVENRICSEFRSSGWFPDQKGGQSLREMTFEYAIVPHKGDWNKGKLFKHAADLNVPPVIYQLPAVASIGHGWKPEKSFCSVKPEEIEISAIKPADNGNGFILRMYNPTEEELNANIKCFEKIQKVSVVNLLEEDVEALPKNGNFFNCNIGRAKIKSFRICF